VLLFFGYTSCPDVCPTTLASWKQVHAVLGGDGSKVRFLFVTVDPERDTPARLKRYLAIFSPDFVGLTGTQQALTATYRAYGVVREKVTRSGSGVGYLVNHTARTYLIDPAGFLRLSYGFGTLPEDIADDIRRLLLERRR
jgi:protein SCO1/2